MDGAQKPKQAKQTSKLEQSRAKASKQVMHDAFIAKTITLRFIIESE